MKTIALPNREDKEMDDTRLFTDLPEDEQKATILWIQTNFLPRKTMYTYISSYGLKHLLEGDIHIYMTNCQFKGAMLACGYEPQDPLALNWYFGLSKRSPAFTRGLRCI